MKNAIIITKKDLKRALITWESNAREEKEGTPFKQDYRKLPLDKMGDIAGDYLWTILIDQIQNSK